MNSNQSDQNPQQNQGAGYASSMQGQSDMGGGQGAFGSGVAGGYQNNQQQQQAPQGQQGQQGQQDWLDKGIEFAADKAGYNIVSGNFQF